MCNDRYDRELKKLLAAGLDRRLTVLETGPGRTTRADGREKLLFCSNNYLGLANDPRIRRAIQKGLERWGFGSGGSRLICGNTTPHIQLQERLARLLDKEAALVFPTGYVTNLTLLCTLAERHDLILIDKLCHASVIDGARASQAKVRTWPHRQTKKLRRLLDEGGYEQAFIVTDSLFSMDGDRADLADLAELKNHYGAMLIVDEAHALGCLGPEGKGVAAEKGVLDEVDLYVGTLSKAMGGAGGFVAGSRTIIDYMVNRGRGFIFTTGVPTINCLAALAALDIIADEPKRRERLRDNSEYFRRRCREMDLDTGNSQSHIVPIILGAAKTAIEAAQGLWQLGFMVPAIRPPTVGKGGSRLRVSLISEHSRDDIDRLCEAIDKVIRQKKQG